LPGTMRQIRTFRRRAAMHNNACRAGWLCVPIPGLPDPDKIVDD
jgi:hypothetical protein